MNRLLMTGFTLAVLSAPVQAEPSPSVSSLMDTPTSAFSFGMYRLDEAVKAHFSSQAPKWEWGDQSFFSSAWYDGDANRIKITASSQYKFENKDAFENACKVVFDSARERAGIDHSSGKLLEFFNVSQFAGYFYHIGYTNDKNRENVAELDKIIEVRFFGFLETGEQGTCFAPLLSNSVAVSY